MQCSGYTDFGVGSAERAAKRHNFVHDPQHGAKGKLHRHFNNARLYEGC